MDYVSEYIEKIQTGEITVNKKIHKWYIENIYPIIQGKDSKYYFDEKKGSRFITFAEKFCKQSKGQWYNKNLKLMLFQKAKYQCLFGILRREDKLRRFKEIFDVRGRKNGKSTENAALALYLVLTEQGAEIYAAATVSSQARRIWEDSKFMIDRSEELQELLGYKVFPSPTIYQKEGSSYYKVLSKNVSTFDGLNVSGAIIDEVHELPRQIYDILRQGTSARKGSILSMITTAGFVRGALYDDTYVYANDVLNGVITDDTLMPLLYELDDPEEIYSESYWIKANPAIDVIKDRESLRDNANKMQGDKNFANTVKVKDFNILGVENRAWLSYDELNVTTVYTEEELKKFDGTSVLGGIDLSKTEDMTSFTTLLFDKENHKIIALTMYWVTEEFLKKQTKANSKINWQAWVDRGLVKVCHGTGIDHNEVIKYIEENLEKHKWIYDFINYDSWCASFLKTDLMMLGFDSKYCLIETHQGAKTLSIPMQIMGQHLKEKILCYQNNDVTKWCLTNVELVEDRNGNYMPQRAGNKRERKIDGFATILDCYVSLCQNLNYYLGYD